MALLSNSFEGGTDGTNITAGNSGGTSGDAFAIVLATGSATKTYTSSNAINGSLSGRITSLNGSDTVVLGYNGFSATSFAYRFYVTFLSDTAANGASIYQTRNSSSSIGNLSMNIGLSLRATYSSSGVTLPGSTYVVSLNTAYRIEGFIEPGATASSGHYKYAVYAGSSLTPLVSVDLTGLDLGSSALIDSRFGKTGAAGTVDAIFDDFAISSSATDFIGPISTPNMTATVAWLTA